MAQASTESIFVSCAPDSRRHPMSMGPKTGWPKYLGLYSNMVHTSHADIVTILPVTQNNLVIAVPYYHPGRKDRSFYLPTANVADAQTPEEAAHLELLHATGHVASNWKKLGRLLVEVKNRAATNYLYLAMQATNSRATQPAFSGSAKPHFIPVNAIADLLASGAFPAQVHSMALLRALDRQCGAENCRST